MKIKRIINGQEIDIELTSEEVLKAMHNDKKWWGGVMWSDEDIEGALIDNGIRPIKERIDTIRERVEYRIADWMIPAGLDLINYEIENLED